MPPIGRPGGGGRGPIHVSSTMPVPLGVAGSWVLDFRDEFDGTAVDETRWQILDPALTWRALGTFANTGDFGNVTWRQQNIAVSGGILTLTLDLDTGTQYGGGIVSLGAQKYGYFESRLQFISGFPAWWIVNHRLGTDATPQDPAVSGTEMDIAESTAFNGTPQLVGNAVHWNGYGVDEQSDLHNTSINDGLFHTFGFWWTPTFYKFYIDGVLDRTFTTAISQDQVGEYMVLNNDFWPGGQTAGTANFDYVRHWVGG